MFDNINPAKDTAAAGQTNQNNKNSTLGAAAPAGSGGSLWRGPSSKAVEDIFSSADEPLKEMPAKPPIFQPKSMAPTPLMGGEKSDSGDFAGGNKKYFLLGLVVLAVVAVGVGGFIGFQKYNPFSKTAETGGNEAAEDITKENGKTSGEAAESSGNENKKTAVNEITSKAADSDQDGLTDEEEKTLGTDPNSIDSDNDGLFDREEAKVYKTNPIKADTDGDGYKDGDEVKNGYNPNGDGKLFGVK